MGKTTLAHTLARLLGLQFSRIQFTSDLLPADITGVSIFDRERGEFRFLPGPVFAQLVLADEINRATPKDPERLAGSDGGRPGDAEGQTRHAAAPILRDRDTEPGAPDRHLSAARIAARPLSDAYRTGLPGSSAAERALLAAGGQREKARTIESPLLRCRPICRLLQKARWLPFMPPAR
jgi:MoxR-like ATPase